MMKLVTIAMLAVMANAQDPCGPSDRCVASGGVCYTRERCLAEGGFVDTTTACAAVTNDNTGGIVECTCCKFNKVPDCAQSEKCKAAGGSCRKECPTGFFSKPDLCNKDRTGCTCCIPPRTASPTESPVKKEQPTCSLTKECAKEFGHCVSREFCEKQFPLFDWVQSMCSVGGDCGCCKPKKTPSPTPKVCPQSSACQTQNGKCMSQTECAQNANTMDWLPNLCNNRGSTANPSCGCCRPKVTKKPTTAPVVAPPKECKQQTPCIAKGGKCLSRQVCEELGNMEWNPKLCLSSPKDPNCGCCTPKKTPKPTPAQETCKQATPCLAQGGKCLARQACEELVNMEWIPNLCLSPNDPNCGCCKPRPEEKTEKPTPSQDGPCKQSQTCMRRGGKCMSRTDCAENHPERVWKPQYCTSVPGTSSSSCGCCARPSAFLG